MDGFAWLLWFFLVFLWCFRFFIVCRLLWNSVVFVEVIRLTRDACFVEHLLKSDLVIELKRAAFALSSVAVDAADLSWLALWLILGSLDTCQTVCFSPMRSLNWRNHFSLSGHYSDEVGQVFKLLPARVAWSTKYSFILFAKRHLPPPCGIYARRNRYSTSFHVWFEVSRILIYSFARF